MKTEHKRCLKGIGEYDKMEIKQVLYNSLMECNWFANCGTDCNSEYAFDTCMVNSEKVVLKNISGIKWERVCMEEQGNLTGYLHMNHRTEYNEYWNKEVGIIKEKYLPAIVDKIGIKLKEKKYSPEIMNDIRYNLIIIMRADFYSEFYTSYFYTNILEIYLSGHVPCGWQGKHPSGKLIVF